MYNLTLEEAQFRLAEIGKLAKRLEGFKVKTDFRQRLDEVAIMLENGWDAQAITEIVNITNGIQATLCSFLKRSPEHFSNILRNIKAEFPGGLDPILEGDIKNAFEKLESLTNNSYLLNTKLGDVAVEYSNVCTILFSVPAEQRRINDFKKQHDAKAAALARAERSVAEMKAKAEREARVAEEKREEERKRRSERAQSLRELAQLIV